MSSEDEKIKGSVSGFATSGILNISQAGGMTWGELEQRPRRTSTWLTTALRAAVAGALLSALAVYSAAGDVNKLSTGDSVALVLAVVAVAGAAVPYLIVQWRALSNENKSFDEAMKYRQAWEQEALEKLRKSTELATLMELNQGQIKDYHTIVTNQADKSFRSSQVAMGIGIAMLVGCLVGGFSVDATQLRWFIAAVAAISSTMAGYLSRTYLDMYKASIAQLNRYFDQPVLNSYYLTAERLSHGLEEDAQHEVRRHIIHEVLKTSAAMSGKKYLPEEEAVEEPKIPPQKKRKQKNPK